MKVKLKIPWLGRNAGQEITVHPARAKAWAEAGICEPFEASEKVEKKIAGKPAETAAKKQPEKRTRSRRSTKSKK